MSMNLVKVSLPQIGMTYKQAITLARALHSDMIEKGITGVFVTPSILSLNAIHIEYTSSMLSSTHLIDNQGEITPQSRLQWFAREEAI